jgi:hypothetical protein
MLRLDQSCRGRANITGVISMGTKIGGNRVDSEDLYLPFKPGTAGRIGAPRMIQMDQDTWEAEVLYRQDAGERQARLLNR